MLLGVISILLSQFGDGRNPTPINSTSQQPTSLETIEIYNYEEEIIKLLFPSMNIKKFEEILGTYIFSRTFENNSKEYVFSRPGYWIQAITNPDEIVLLYAITVCDSDFTPTVENLPFGEPIEIGVTTFKEVADNPTPHYYISGATANSFLIEELSFGNPGRYQTIFWGYNDACQDQWLTQLIEKHGVALLEALSSVGYVGFQPENRILLSDETIDEFRTTTPFNTVAVTGPFIDSTTLDGLMQEYYIGVDRIQIRVLSNP